MDPVSTGGRRRLSILPGFSSSRFLRCYGPGTRKLRDQAPPAGCRMWMSAYPSGGCLEVRRLSAADAPRSTYGRRVRSQGLSTSGLHTCPGHVRTQAEGSTPAPGWTGFEDKLFFVLLASCKWFEVLFKNENAIYS